MAKHLQAVLFLHILASFFCNRKKQGCGSNASVLVSLHFLDLFLRLHCKNLYTSFGLFFASSSCSYPFLNFFSVLFIFFPTSLPFFPSLLKLYSPERVAYSYGILYQMCLLLLGCDSKSACSRISLKKAFLECGGYLNAAGKEIPSYLRRLFAVFPSLIPEG